MPAERSVIARPVEIICGASNIGKFLGIRVEDVRTLPSQGAPIFKRGKRGDFVCEKAETWNWYKASLNKQGTKAAEA